MSTLETLNMGPRNMLLLLPVLVALCPTLIETSYLIGRGVADTTGVIAEGILVSEISSVAK